MNYINVSMAGRMRRRGVRNISGDKTWMTYKQTLILFSFYLINVLNSTQIVCFLSPLVSVVTRQHVANWKKPASSKTRPRIFVCLFVSFIKRSDYKALVRLCQTSDSLGDTPRTTSKQASFSSPTCGKCRLIIDFI